MLDTKTNGAGPALNGNGNGANGARAVQKEELVTIEANNSFNEGPEQVCSLRQSFCPLKHLWDVAWQDCILAHWHCHRHCHCHVESWA